MIHPGAIIHPDARIADDVTIGPYSVIGADVDIGTGTHIASHTVINGPTRIGRDNYIHPFCVIGGDPQDRKYHGEPESVLEIGDRNTIREHCSINRGTLGGGGLTRIGSDNWIMASVHIAHDCLIGDGNVFANNTTLAGHVTVEDHTVLGGFTGIHQFCRVGRHALTAIAAVVVKDVPPYVIVAGNTARPNGINRVGLRRHGVSQERIDLLRRAYRILYRDGLLLADALERLTVMEPTSPEIACLAGFIRESGRGIAR